MKKLILPLLCLVSLISCENDSNDAKPTGVVLANQSVTPVLLTKKAGFENV